MILAFFETLARLAPLGTFCIALTALLIARRQLKTARQNEAMKQYLSYLDDCMKNPRLAIGIYEDQIEVYNQFLNKALWAHESILREFEGDKEWYNATLRHLEPHIMNIHKFETDFYDIGLKTYSKEIQNLFKILRNKSITEKELRKQENNNE